jgi:predicted membrane protein
MRIRGQVLFGIIIVLIGLAVLVGNVFDVDVGVLCFPVGLILVGGWLLVRPRLVGRDTALRMRFFGSFRRSGAWQVSDQEIWLLIGDVRLDLSEAEIPVGETHIRVFSFVSEVRMNVPEGVGASLTSMGFVNEVRVLGKRRTGFVFPVNLSSDGYQAAERKVHVESMGFVSDMRASQT